MRAPSIRTMLSGAFALSLLAITPPGQASVLVGCQGGDFADNCSLQELAQGGWIKAGRAIFQDFQVSQFPGQSEVLVTPVEYKIADSWFGELRFQRYESANQGTKRVPTITDPGVSFALNVRSDDEAVFRSYWAQLRGAVVPAGQGGIVRPFLSITEQPRANTLPPPQSRLRSGHGIRSQLSAA